MKSALALALPLLLSAACALEGGIVGSGPAGDDDDDNPAPQTPDAAPVEGDPDAAPVPQGLSITGSVLDFSSATPLAAAQLTTEGLTPALVATSDAAGVYSMADLPAASIFSVAAAMAADYRPTANPLLTTTGMTAGVPGALDIHVVSSVYAERQASTMGLATLPDTAILVIDLLSGEGLPKEGIPLESIKLRSAGGAIIGAGPYFLGALGDVDAAVLTSTTYNGHARVAFLNVPPGIQSLSVTFGGGGGGGTPITIAVPASAGGATLTRIQGGVGAGM